MRVRCLVMLTMALAALMPAVAGERESSFSLKQLRVIARSAHPTLDAAEAAVEASSGILKQSQAYPNPEISVGFGRGRPREGGDSKWENQIELMQPIEMPGIRRWRKRLAEVRLRSVEIDRLLAQAIVDSTVASLAYSVLLEERRAEIALESVEVAGRLHETLARRAEIGESSSLEVSRAQTEWFSRRRDLLDAEGAAGAARSALRLFCGGRLPAAYRITEALEDPQATDLPEHLAERLRGRNPLVLRAGNAVEEAQARTEVARKEVFPVVELSAGYEKELDREAGSVGVGLTIPLWNRNHGAIMAATAQQSAASAEVRALTLELEVALEQASTAYRQALGAIRLHQEGWSSAARRSLDVVTFSFENGEASLLDVLDAQRSYLSVGLAEAESWAELALARADIERLTAGSLASEDTDEHP